MKPAAMPKVLTKLTTPVLSLAVALLPCLGLVWAQSDAFDEESVALIYHKITGEPLDVRAVAEQSEVVRRTSNFDRPDVIKAETARLQQQLNAANPARSFVIRVSDSITEYDHSRGEFSIRLFTPGSYVPVTAFNQQYQLVFANAESARAIAMPKDQAREFDAQLNRTVRQVTGEIHFRIIGKGDPSGGVTGARVVRAEMTAARLLDSSGNVVFTPKVAPFQAAASSGGSPFGLAVADIAGFRVGVKAKDLETTLTRLFGPAQRSAAKGTGWFAGKLTVNEMGCVPMFGRRSPQPGSVCVTAHVDRDGIVRSIRVERVFSYFDAEIFRKAVTQKYGPVASAAGGSDFVLGWGPEVDPKLRYTQAAPHNALTAHYTNNADFISRSGNALPQIRIVLNLVDAGWAAGRK